MAIKWTFNPFTSNLDALDVPNQTNYAGSDCSGLDGDPNRTLSAPGARWITVDGMTPRQTTDYTISGSTITFLNNIFDSQVIIAWS